MIYFYNYYNGECHIIRIPKPWNVIGLFGMLLDYAL